MNSNKLFTLYLVLTETCNLSCRYCHVVKQSDALDISVYLNMIYKLLEDKNNINIVFFGGEPLIRKHEMITIVDEVSTYCHNMSKSVSFSINTNGTLIDNIIAKFFKANNIYVIVSLDGKTIKENQERLYDRDEKAFDDIIRGMNILLENQVIFGVSSVLHKNNYTNMKNFLIWLKQVYNIRKVGINLIHHNINEVKNEDTFDDVNVLPDIIRYSYKIDIEIPQYTPRINNFRNGIKNPMYCAACSYNKIILYPNNTVARCENHLSQRLPVNLHNELTVVKYNGSDCTSCKAADLCGGGCLPDMNIDYLKERWCRLSKGMYEIATDGEL